MWEPIPWSGCDENHQQHYYMLFLTSERKKRSGVITGLKEICEVSHSQSWAATMCPDLCFVILHKILILMTAGFVRRKNMGQNQRLCFWMACVQIPFKVSIMREALTELMRSVNNVQHKSAEAGAKICLKASQSISVL